MTSETFNSQAKATQTTSQADILIVDDTPVNLRLLSQILDDNTMCFLARVHLVLNSGLMRGAQSR